MVFLNTQIKPLLNVAWQEEEMKAKEEELRNAMAKTQELLGKVKELEEKTAMLGQEKNDLTIQLRAVRGPLGAGRELGALARVRPRGGRVVFRVPPDHRQIPAFSFLHCNVTFDPSTPKCPPNSCLPPAAGWLTHSPCWAYRAVQTWWPQDGGGVPRSGCGSAKGPQELALFPLPSFPHPSSANTSNDRVSMGSLTPSDEWVHGRDPSGSQGSFSDLTLTPAPLDA